MLMIGIAGTEIGADERAALLAPQVIGLILFSRNFRDREQLARLVDSLRELREDLLIAVDQEGGPVQRFRDGFARLPALAAIGDVYRHDHARAVVLAEEHAWLMASELRAIGVDLSFAPVADLRLGNRAIGIRAFHPDPETVSALTLAYVRGMRLAGMAATLKHFPGHGSVLEDTHVEAARDPRPLAAMRAADLLPFRDAIAAGAEAVMMAHVEYPAVDAVPAGFSRRWIGDVLRGELGFNGIVFSDDIGMSAAATAGGVGARIAAHLDAGCDIVLACAPATAVEAIAAVARRPALEPARLSLLRGTVAPTWEGLMNNPMRARVIAALAPLRELPA
jgi:beta-N-acetylhexosaminidase